MKKTSKAYYTVTSLVETSVSELDFDLYDELFPEIDANELSAEDWYLRLGQYNNEGYPIQIDRMIRMLEEIKKQGANYVALDYHCDHIGYDLEGLNIRRSTPDEIKARDLLQQNRNKKAREIKKLEAQIKKLRTDEEDL